MSLPPLKSFMNCTAYTVFFVVYLHTLTLFLYTVDENAFDDIVKTLPAPTSLKQSINPLEFEKDDDSNFHMDFITACSNLRAENYSIAPADKHKVCYNETCVEEGGYISIGIVQYILLAYCFLNPDFVCIWGTFFQCISSVIFFLLFT